MPIIGEDFNNRHEIIKNYRFKINENLMKLIYKILGVPINDKYYDEFKHNDTYYLDYYNMNYLFNEICKKYNLFSEFNKPIEIDEKDFLYFLIKHNTHMNMLNKYFKNGKCLFNIKKLFYEDNYQFWDVEKIILIFNELQTIKENMYEFSNYKKIKKIY